MWWVRHGPTHAKEMIGWTDRPADLSDVAAIARLRAYLPADAAVVSSDLVRAVATAAALGGRHSLTPLPALRELHFGAWEGLRFAQIEAQEPALIRRFWEEPGDVAAPGGESWNDLRARVDAAVDGLLAQAARDVIVVAHFGVILTQVQRARAIPAAEAFSQRIDPLSVTRIDVEDGRFCLHGVNHLP